MNEMKNDLNFPHEKFQVILVDFIDFSLERNNQRSNGQTQLCCRNYRQNKAGYTATLVACGWAGAVIDKVTLAFGQEQLAQNARKRRKSK